MKKNAFTLFLSLIVVVITTACEQQEDDYYTQVDITLQTNDSITPLKIQGTTSLRNLSNGRTYASIMRPSGSKCYEEPICLM